MGCGPRERGNDLGESQAEGDKTIPLYGISQVSQNWGEWSSGARTRSLLCLLRSWVDPIYKQQEVN